MAKWRSVHTQFWTDSRVVEEFTPEDRYFFLYLLTNQNTTQIGIYQITKRQIAFDLGYSTETVNALLERFINYHKLIRYNPNTKELAIKNWGKYNLVRGGKPVLDCVSAELRDVKDDSLIAYVSEQITNPEIKRLFDTYTLRGTCRGEKEEEEKEEEEYQEEEQEEQEVGGKNPPPTPHQQIQELFNTLCPSFPRVISLGKTRRKHLQARWKQFNYDLSVFETAFKRVEASEFCKGKNDKNWKVSFDWLIQNDSNMVKVLEGKYDNRLKVVHGGGSTWAERNPGVENHPFYNKHRRARDAV